MGGAAHSGGRRAAARGDGREAAEKAPAPSTTVVRTRSAAPASHSSFSNPRERKTYLPRLRLIGYHAVSVWLRELTVDAGETRAVELSDRNVWLTGIEEERVRDADR